MSSSPLSAYGRKVALCGGTDGARLAFGRSRILPRENLIVIVNTGDDSHHFGLYASPDIDTVAYTRAERANGASLQAMVDHYDSLIDVFVADVADRDVPASGPVLSMLRQ